MVADYPEFNIANLSIFVVTSLLIRTLIDSSFTGHEPSALLKHHDMHKENPIILFPYQCQRSRGISQTAARYTTAAIVLHKQLDKQPITQVPAKTHVNNGQNLHPFKNLKTQFNKLPN